MNNAYVAALSKKEVIMLIFIYLGLISKHMTVKMYMYEYIYAHVSKDEVQKLIWLCLAYCLFL